MSVKFRHKRDGCTSIIAEYVAGDAIPPNLWMRSEEWLILGVHPEYGSKMDDLRCPDCKERMVPLGVSTLQEVAA